MHLARCLLYLAILSPGCTVSDLGRLSADYGSPAGGAGAGGDGEGGDTSAGQGGGGNAGASGAGGAGNGGLGGTGGSGGSSGAGGGGKAGGGGSAGSGGSGGGGGSSGAAGSAGSAGATSVCASAGMSCTGCRSCVGTQGGDCAAEAAACSMNAECNALTDCYANCAFNNNACFTMCDTMHSGGVKDYGTLSTCSDAACKQPCTISLVCDAIPSVSMGSCFSGAACNPVTNMGCDATAGLVCAGDGTGVFQCFGPPPPLDSKLCASCNDHACGPGLTCLLTSTDNTAQCSITCCVDADCGPTGKCSATTTGVGGFCEKK